MCDTLNQGRAQSVTTRKPLKARILLQNYEKISRSDKFLWQQHQLHISTFDPHPFVYKQVANVNRIILPSLRARFRHHSPRSCHHSSLALDSTGSRSNSILAARLRRHMPHVRPGASQAVNATRPLAPLCAPSVTVFRLFSALVTSLFSVPAKSLVSVKNFPKQVSNMLTTSEN
jgi:hypothetical protein